MYSESLPILFARFRICRLLCCVRNASGTKLGGADELIKSREPVCGIDSGHSAAPRGDKSFPITAELALWRKVQTIRLLVGFALISRVLGDTPGLLLIALIGTSSLDPGSLS